MADLPIINNLRDKLIPNRNNDDDDYFEDSEVEEGSPEHDVLEQYRIALNTELREDVLTPSKLSKVKFGVTQPKGFNFKQVEVFHSEVSKSVQWYISALEKRDRDVHKLATEVDKYKTDVQNARFQLEVLQGMGGQAVVDDSGEYVKESQLSQDQLNAIELENRVAELENDLKYERRVNTDLQAQLEKKNSAPAPVAFPPLSSGTPSSAELAELAELRERQVEIDAWEEAVTAEYERIEGELENTKNLLASKEADNQKLRAELSAVNEQLRNALNNAETSSDETEGYLASIASLEEQLRSSNEELAEVLSERETLIGQRDSALDELEAVRSVEPVVVADGSTSAELEALNEKLAEVEKHVEDLDAYSLAVENSLSEKIAELEEKDKTLQEYAEVLAEKDRLIAEKDRILAERNAAGGYSGERIPGYRLPEGITAEDLGLE